MKPCSVYCHGITHVMLTWHTWRAIVLGTFTGSQLQLGPADDRTVTR